MLDVVNVIYKDETSVLREDHLVSFRNFLNLYSHNTNIVNLFEFTLPFVKEQM